MPQTARPDADLLVSNHQTQAGGTSNLYATIDEAAANDTDYVKSPASPANEVYVARLSDVVDPVSSSNHVVRFRYSTDVNTGGESLDLLVQLKQGYTNEGAPGTTIASTTITGITGTAWVSTSFTLSGGEADAISDYTDLALRFRWNKP